MHSECPLWVKWWKHRIETRTFPDEMGEPLIVLCRRVCRRHSASQFSLEGWWFEKRTVEGKVRLYPTDSVQQVIAETLRALIHYRKRDLTNLPDTKTTKGKSNDEKLECFIQAVMTNKIRNLWRKRIKEVRMSDMSEEQEEAIRRTHRDPRIPHTTHSEEEDWIRYVILNLSDEELDALYYHDCLGYKDERISTEVFGGKLSRTTVANRRYAAREKFREARSVHQEAFTKLLREIVQEEREARRTERKATRPKKGVLARAVLAEEVVVPKGFMKKINEMV